MITTTKVKATKFYKNLDGLGQKMILNKKSMEDIKLGYNMSKLTSYDNWLKVCSPRDKIRDIVSELITEQLTNISDYENRNSKKRNKLPDYL